MRDLVAKASKIERQVQQDSQDGPTTFLRTRDSVKCRRGLIPEPFFLIIFLGHHLHLYRTLNILMLFVFFQQLVPCFSIEHIINTIDIPIDLKEYWPFTEFVRPRVQFFLEDGVRYF